MQMCTEWRGWGRGERHGRGGLGGGSRPGTAGILPTSLSFSSLRFYRGSLPPLLLFRFVGKDEFFDGLHACCDFWIGHVGVSSVGDDFYVRRNHELG